MPLDDGDDWTDDESSSDDELAWDDGRIQERTVAKGENEGHLPTPPASPPDALMAVAMFGSTVTVDHAVTALPGQGEGKPEGTGETCGSFVRELSCVNRDTHGVEDSQNRGRRCAMSVRGIRIP